jgi:hypothetical protein
MAEITVRFDVRMNQRTARWALAALLVLAAAPQLASEDITLSTYYPAPSGVYSQMVTTGKTYLARDGNFVGIRMGTTDPTYPLQVGGTGSGANIYGATPEIYANGDNHTGGGILVADDGGFFDYNDGWITYNGSTGLKIAGNSGPSSSGNLDVTGNLTSGGAVSAHTFDGAYMPSYLNWATYGTGAGGAAIYNDHGSYQQLMIVGNNSSGGNRKVGVWDQLNVNGSEYISSYLDNSGNTDMGGYARANDYTGQNGACYAANANPNQSGICPGGDYATLDSGFYGRYVSLGTFYRSESENSQSTIDFFCCACPSGGCNL